MIHLDLFSGIGGFAYATEQVWDNVEHVFCEMDPFCKQVLAKHWPESEIYDDIRSITADTDFARRLYGQPEEQSAKRRQQAQRKSESGFDPPFLLTGGFPCQPFSAAGLRRGTADERHLWPEMLRVIRLTKPEWVIAENVRGILTWNEGMVFEQVCLDLEAAGYEVQPFIIPAVAVNAPHRRDRVWFVANRGRERWSARTEEIQSEGQEPKREDVGERGRKPVANSKRKRQSGQVDNGQSINEKAYKTRQTNRSDNGCDWSRSWSEVAAELCSMDDGLPVRLDEPIHDLEDGEIYELSKARHRKEQLKAYGNAIVPQVAVEIMRGMA